MRLAAVRKLSDSGIAVSVLAHPAMPLINDSAESLDRICAAAAQNGASGFSAAPLFLPPCARQVFFPFLEQHFPHLVHRYLERFQRSAYLRSAHLEMLRSTDRPRSRSRQHSSLLLRFTGSNGLRLES